MMGRMMGRKEKRPERGVFTDALAERVAAAYRAAHRLKLKGLEVEVVTPPTMGDWLDVLNERQAKDTEGCAMS